jgi:hypothetical protein
VLLALAVGVLLAVSVAVPVIASSLGTQAISGYSRMYQFQANTDDGYWGDWSPTAKSTVRMTFDTWANPYLIKYQLVGTRLVPGEYALVNVFGLYEDEEDSGDYEAYVRLLGTTFTNKAGMLTMKGAVGGSEGEWPLLEPCLDESVAPHTDRFEGAEVWLVPASELDDPCDDLNGMSMYTLHINTFPGPEPGYYYGALGLPAPADSCGWGN